MSALIVVDMQEDFCPPNGSLAVTGGRSIAPTINSLLSLNFTTRIATLDYHPKDHMSFAINHTPPNNVPFSTIKITNPTPGRGTETKDQVLWPVHCVAGEKGAELIPEIDNGKIDVYVKKGLNPQVEMYSVFADPFGNFDPDSVDVDVTSLLSEKQVTDVFVVGLAGDYCVMCTALDAVKAGHRTFIVEDATCCVDRELRREGTKRELEANGVSVIKADDPELLKLST